MSRQIQKVAVIGLGRMGSTIARRILGAGFDTTVYNRTAAKMDPLVQKGAKGAPSPREAAAGADAVVTCLMGDASVFDVVLGEDGLLAGLTRGAVHIGTTTVSPRCSTQLAELHASRGSRYLAAPIIGRPDMAEIGRVMAFVAGDYQAMRRCVRLFKSYASGITNVGKDHAVANSAQLVFTYMTVSLIEMIGDVYAFGERSGINGAVLNGLVSAMLGPPALKDYAHRIHARDFDDVSYDLLSGLRDVQLILQAADETRVPLSYACIIRERFLAAAANGLGDKDWCAITEITRMNAGLN
ncbi:MAG TPA: NAD(P)-dependent oxidoreductase [Dehalococcoidia bacterium]|nr:NAD(P)-dependent oxidoreductase [Dehalococcoidia bacterium]